VPEMQRLSFLLYEVLQTSFSKSLSSCRRMCTHAKAVCGWLDSKRLGSWGAIAANGVLQRSRHLHYIRTPWHSSRPSIRCTLRLRSKSCCHRCACWRALCLIAYKSSCRLQNTIFHQKQYQKCVICTSRNAQLVALLSVQNLVF
jgi:hypothetical protein